LNTRERRGLRGGTRTQGPRNCKSGFDPHRQAAEMEGHSTTAPFSQQPVGLETDLLRRLEIGAYPADLSAHGTTMHLEIDPTCLPLGL